MSDITDAEVIKFMEQNYPDLKNNLKLAKLMYQRQKLKSPVSGLLNSPFEVKIKEIKTLADKSRVAFTGIVAEIEKKTYEGCPSCKRRVCEHGLAPIEYTVYNILIGDDEDMVACSAFDTLNGVTEGTRVNIVGGVKIYREERSVAIYEMKKAEEKPKPVVQQAQQQTTGNTKADKIIQFIGESAKAGMPCSLNMVDAMCEGEGISFKDIQGSVIVDTVNRRVLPKEGV